MKLTIYTLIVVLSALSCTTSRTKNKANSAPVSQGLVAPNHCRILARVTAVKNSMRFYPDGPCSKAPCDAEIEIINVLGYGSAFKKVLNPGEKLEARFAFTLSPSSKELFPNMQQSLPGLKEGDLFTADLESSVVPENEIVYTIYDYTPN